MVVRMGMAGELGRIVIDELRPSTPRRYPAKAAVGEAVRVSADIYKDGHDVLAARVSWSGPDGKWAAAPLRELGNDRWEGVIQPTSVGRHEFAVEAWTDAYATWRHKAMVKLEAEQEVGLELEEAAIMFEDHSV